MTQEELVKLSRAELNEKATAKGLDPEQFNNKGEVIEALLDENSDKAKDDSPEQATKTDDSKGQQLPGHPTRFDESGNPIYK